MFGPLVATSASSLPAPTATVSASPRATSTFTSLSAARTLGPTVSFIISHPASRFTSSSSAPADIAPPEHGSYNPPNVDADPHLVTSAGGLPASIPAPLRALLERSGPTKFPSYFDDEARNVRAELASARRGSAAHALTIALRRLCDDGFPGAALALFFGTPERNVAHWSVMLHSLQRSGHELLFRALWDALLRSPVALDPVLLTRPLLAAAGDGQVLAAERMLTLLITHGSAAPAPALALLARSYARAPSDASARRVLALAEMQLSAQLPTAAHADAAVAAKPSALPRVGHRRADHSALAAASATAVSEALPSSLLASLLWALPRLGATAAAVELLRLRTLADHRLRVSDLTPLLAGLARAGAPDLPALVQWARFAAAFAPDPVAAPAAYVASAAALRAAGAHTTAIKWLALVFPSCAPDVALAARPYAVAQLVQSLADAHYVRSLVSLLARAPGRLNLRQHMLAASALTAAGQAVPALALATALPAAADAVTTWSAAAAHVLSRGLGQWATAAALSTAAEASGDDAAFAAAPGLRAAPALRHRALFSAAPIPAPTVKASQSATAMPEAYVQKDDDEDDWAGLDPFALDASQEVWLGAATELMTHSQSSDNSNQTTPKLNAAGFATAFDLSLGDALAPADGRDDGPRGIAVRHHRRAPPLQNNMPSPVTSAAHVDQVPTSTTDRSAPPVAPAATYRSALTSVALRTAAALARALPSASAGDPAVHEAEAAALQRAVLLSCGALPVASPQDAVDAVFALAVRACHGARGAPARAARLLALLRALGSHGLTAAVEDLLRAAPWLRALPQAHCEHARAHSVAAAARTAVAAGFAPASEIQTLQRTLPTGSPSYRRTRAGAIDTTRARGFSRLTREVTLSLDLGPGGAPRLRLPPALIARIDRVASDPAQLRAAAVALQA